MWDKKKKKNKILKVYQCSPEWWDTFINLSYLNIFFVLSRMEIDSKMKNNAAPQIYDLSIKAKGLNVLYEETAFFSYRGLIVLQKDFWSYLNFYFSCLSRQSPLSDSEASSL